MLWCTKLEPSQASHPLRKGKPWGVAFRPKVLLEDKEFTKIFPGGQLWISKKIFDIYNCIYIYISYLSILSSHTLHVFFWKNPPSKTSQLPGFFQRYPCMSSGMRPCYKAFWRRCRTAEVAAVKLGVSKNNGTPKSSILIGFSIINHPFWGTPIFGNTQLKLNRKITVGKHGGNVQNIPWWLGNQKLLGRHLGKCGHVLFFLG